MMRSRQEEDRAIKLAVFLLESGNWHVCSRPEECKQNPAGTRFEGFTPSGWTYPDAPRCTSSSTHSMRP